MISTWIVVLYFCVTTSCFTVVLPTEYLLLKECNFYNKTNYPAYNNASAIEVDGGYFHSIDGNRVKFRAGPPGGGDSTERFIITPLDSPRNEQVTFNVSSNAGDTNTFRMRAPGQSWDFRISRAGQWTGRIPFGRKDEVHILGNQGKIRFADNWQTIYFEDRPGGTDFDDLIIKCSTGRFFSNGRKLNTDYSYKYPHFVPTIDWGHGIGSGEGEIVLTENDDWCGVLKTGVDYGVRFETSGEQGGRNHGANILDGKTTAQKIAYSVGSVTGPFDDLEVTCDKGRFRSKDGTDDWGYFGHSGDGIGGSSSRVDQILWSMPKVQPSGPKWNPDKNGLRFTFSAKDGSHRFEIKPNDVKRGVGKRHWNSSGVQKTTRRIKLNTIYNVHASINAFTGNESLDRCEQGFVPKLGRGVFAQNQQQWEDTIPNGGKNQYIFAEVIPSQPWEDSTTPSGGDGDDLQIGATRGTFKHWNKRRHKDAPYTSVSYTHLTLPTKA